MDGSEIARTKVAATASDEDGRYRAPALDKGLDIIELLSRQSGGLTRGEIAAEMGRSPGEVYRMLERLVARGYVGRSLQGDRYALTMKLFALAHLYPPLRRLIAPAQPLMDGFSLAVGQSCHLVARDGDRAVVVAHASCPGNYEFALRIGAGIDLAGTGSGRLLLAFSSPEERARLRGSLGGGGAPDWDALEPELERCRRLGHRVEHSRQVRGIRDISVPILSPDGFALAVLTCPFIERMDVDDRFDDAVARLREIAGHLSMSGARP